MTTSVAALANGATGSFSGASGTLSLTASSSRPETARCDAADYAGPRCQVRNGPCMSWKGSVHGYTCSKCLTAYIEASAARAAAKEQREAEKLARKQSPELHTDKPVTDLPPLREARRAGALLRSTAPASVAAAHESSVTARSR